VAVCQLKVLVASVWQGLSYGANSSWQIPCLPAANRHPRTWIAEAGRALLARLSSQWLLPYGIITAEEGQNDGLVSADSAQRAPEEVEVRCGVRYFAGLAASWRSAAGRLTGFSPYAK